MIPRRTGLVASSTVAVTLVTAGAALAYILATGEGTGTASSADLSDVHLQAETPDLLAPGEAGLPVTVRYTNPNGFKVRAQHGIDLEVDTSPEAGWPASCDPADFPVTDIPGPVEFQKLTGPTEIPTHAGGVITWRDGDDDQASCLIALADLGGVPLRLTFPTTG